MYTVTACYVVLVARVDKQVGISAGIYTGFHKRQGVLWHAGIVMIVVNNQQVTFQLTGKILQVTFFVAFRIAFRCVHIAFAVHHFIITPVDYRTSGNAYFEYLRVTEHQGGSHVTSKAPSMYADALAVYVGEGFQEFNAFHLIFAFFDTETAEGGIFKC